MNLRNRRAVLKVTAGKTSEKVDIPLSTYLKMRRAAAKEKLSIDAWLARAVRRDLEQPKEDQETA